MSEKEKGPLDLDDFPRPNEEDPPTDEEWSEDFEREGDEEAGIVPRPFKTIPFWVSLVATIVAYLLASNIIPEDTTTWHILIYVSTTLAYFGYDHVIGVFRNNQGQLRDTIPNYRKPAFYVSLVSTMAGYALGSGALTPDMYAQVTGMIGLVAGHLGITLIPWIRRQGMSDPVEDPQGFFMKVVEFVYKLFYAESHKKEQELRSNTKPELPNENEAA